MLFLSVLPLLGHHFLLLSSSLSLGSRHDVVNAEQHHTSLHGSLQNLQTALIRVMSHTIAMLYNNALVGGATIQVKQKTERNTIEKSQT